MRQPLPGGLRGGGFGARPLCVKRGGRNGPPTRRATEIGFTDLLARSTTHNAGTLSGVAHSTQGP